MFCSECRQEYREGVRVCVDCHRSLVAELPPEPGPVPEPDLSVVTVLAGRDEGRLGVAKSLLASAGIRFIIAGETPRHPGFGPVGGVSSLQVASRDASSAEKLLRDLK
jgi:hypothetical protein